MANKAFATYCFPLKDPWTLSSMNLLTTGQSINESEMKKCLSLIKKVKKKHNLKIKKNFFNSRPNTFYMEESIFLDSILIAIPRTKRLMNLNSLILFAIDYNRISLVN